jgi:predicted ATPase/DNA-binding SARP family transcriptional activator
VEFRVLGPLEVVGDDGAAVPLGGPRPRAVLAALLVEVNRTVSVDRLIDAVWGASPPASAQNALQVHVHALRGVLGADRIATRPPGYVLRVGDDELDAVRFDRLVAEGRPAEALALWRGAALADVAHEPFAQVEAARLEERRLAALEARIDADIETGGHTQVAAELDALVADHPHRERLRAQQMLALYRSGRQADALAAYREARHALDELGLEPSAELRALEQQILRQDPSLDLPAAAAPAQPEPASLPADTTPLVGRELEIAAVTSLLMRPELRLVTLTGPGGTGKTRLALAAARSMAGDLRVVFVDLSAVVDPTLVVPTVAHVLGASESPGSDPVATVVTTLSGNPTLLVLDNLEQVLEAAVDLARLLDAAGELRVLATSRAPLRIMRERIYAVQPLPVPDVGADTARGIEHVAAVRLYVERVHAADPRFVVTDENAGAIARICRALDGLPLALELAAARMRTLGAEGTAARLGERLSLLSRGARDLPERQRSLRATLDWSIQLLESDPLRVLGALAAFSGGASLDAVEAIAAGSDVPSALEDLLDAALVTRATGGDDEPRFGMLETVREYAAELLASSGEEPEVRDRHLDWFLALVEGEGLYWQRDTDREWLDRIELEHDNFRAALDHAVAIGDAHRELRLANALRYFWRVRGYVVEGRRRLEAAVERSGSVEPELRARTLGEAGIMAFTGGDYERSRELWLQALPLIEGAGEPREIARAHFELGAWAHAQGALPEARRRYETAREALADVDDPIGQATVLGNLAVVYQATGEPARAREASEAALALYERSGDLDGLAVTTLNMAYVELGNDDLPAAGRRLGEALAWAERLGHREVLAYAVGYGAELALALERADDAAMLCGAFDQMFEVIDSVPQPDEVERHAKLVERLSGQVDVREAMARGNALPPDAVIAPVRDVVAAA